MRVGFLFDNDGVLMDTSAFHWLSWQLLMKEDSRLFLDEDSFVKGFGKRNDLILQDAAPSSDENQREKWAARKEALFREYARGRISLLPGMEDFLKELKEAHIPRIIASSTPVENLQMFLGSTVLGDYFESFVSAEQVPEGKPAPDVFLAAADQIGFDPKDCIVIEDAPAGLLAARRAGCFVIALETTHSKEMLTNYDLAFSSARELHLQPVVEAFTEWKNKN